MLIRIITFSKTPRKHRVHFNYIMDVCQRMSKIKSIHRKFGSWDKRLRKRNSRKVGPTSRKNQNTFRFIVPMLDKSVIEEVVDTIFITLRRRQFFVLINKKRK